MDRDALLKAMQDTAEAKPREITVPKWGTVYVREITVAEVEAQTEDKSDDKSKHAIARGVARILCDEKGKRLFNPDSAEDVAFLGKQPWSLLRHIIKEDDSGN